MEEDGLDGALVGVLVKKSFLVRCVVVCLWDGCVVMLFSSVSARVWGLVSGCVLVCCADVGRVVW